MQSAPAVVVTLFSVLFPAKTWFAPGQPLTIHIKPPPTQTISLVLSDFTGKPIEANAPTEISAEQDVDLAQLFQPITLPSTYVLWAVSKGGTIRDFVGTPLVIDVKDDQRRDAPPGAMVIRVDPLCYARITTNAGEMNVAFFYDVAPNTVQNFIALSRGGFYDGLTFHRVVPGFVIQGGDPRGDGTGGPGYTIDAEFNDREHREGVLSMSRQPDPLEVQGAAPRPEFANTAGSQFFICLNHERTKQLDGRYTAFGKVIDGMKAVEAIAATAVEKERPTTPPAIRSITIEPVTPSHNPYLDLIVESRK